MLQHFCQLQLLLFQKLVVQIELIAKITLHILTIAVHDTKVHIQQSGATVDVEISCRNAVLGKVFRVLHFIIASGGDEDERLIQSHQLINLFQQGGQFRIQTDISVL